MGKGVAICIVDYLWQHVSIMKATFTLSVCTRACFACLLSFCYPHSVFLCWGLSYVPDFHFALQIAVSIAAVLCVSPWISILFPLRRNIQSIYKTLLSNHAVYS